MFFVQFQGANGGFETFDSMFDAACAYFTDSDAIFFGIEDSIWIF
jgi:hypothetical protein